jgi:hypothetical protein
MAPAMPLHLLKRDDGNMGFALPPSIIILLIMIGALILVCMGYAIHKTFGFPTDGNGFKDMSVAQMDYMAEVRIRNMEHLEQEGRRAWAGKKPIGRGEVVYD